MASATHLHAMLVSLSLLLSHSILLYTQSLFCAGILNDVLSLILHRLKGSSVVVTLSDQQQIGRKKEEAAKEKLLQKAYQFLAAFTRLVPFLYAGCPIFSWMYKPLTFFCDSN